MNKKLYSLMNWEQIEAIVYADTANPFSVLGRHEKKGETILNAYFPGADKVYVVLPGSGSKRAKKIEMEMADESGFFSCLLTKEKFDKYTYTVEYANTEKKEVYDPYAFPVSFDDKAAASIRRGTNEVVPSLLGAKVTTIDGVEGTLFNVYAPDAERISVVGDFNTFEEGAHLMEKVTNSGIFALFVPGAKEGMEYAYRIKGKAPKSVEIADPFGLCGKENRSIITTPDFDKKPKPLKKKAAKAGEQNPVHLYEVDLFSLLDDKITSCLDLLPALIKHCKEYSYTGLHIISIWECDENEKDRLHIKGLYSVSARLGGPKAFAEFVDQLHAADLTVSLNLPFAYMTEYTYDLSSGFSLSFFISAAIYLIRQFSLDGYVIPNLSAILYLDYGKRDGEWIPNEYGGNLNLACVRFLKKLNAKIAKLFPYVVKIASSNGVLDHVTTKSGKDSLLFDYVLNNGFEEGLIGYLMLDPFYRNGRYHEFASMINYAFVEDFILPLSSTVSSKDYASLLMRMPGTLEDKVKNVILANAFLTVYPGKKLNFMGTDTFCDEAYFANPYADSLKEKKNLSAQIKCIKDLFAIYDTKGILRPEGESAKNFTLLKADDPTDNVLIFKREDNDKNIEYILFNFSNSVMEKYSFGIPAEGKIKEIFTTDDEKYKKDGAINKNAIATKEIPMDGFGQSVTVKIPAMGMTVFSYRPFTEKELKDIAHKKYLEKVRYVEQKKKEIEEEKNRIIAEACKDAEMKIKELEKILK